MDLRNLKTKIFLDSSDPKETEEALEILGFLDGQTTNPTLFSKKPDIAQRIERGEKLPEKEVLELYKKTAKEIARLIPHGSISLEVYADEKTKAKEIVERAKEIFSWIENAHVKIPIIVEGLKAAEKLLKEGIRLNFTLCFSQEQAAAVFSLTKGSKENQVFVSPFVGRLDDQGENGMDLIKNIIKMFEKTDKHLKVLVASVRKLEHLLYAIYLGADIVTCPLRVLKEWKEKDFLLPGEDFKYQSENLKPIPYREIDLDLPWKKFDISHPLTEIGLRSFAKDWKKLVL